MAVLTFIDPDQCDGVLPAGNLPPHVERTPMTNFPSLQKLIPEIDHAESIFELKTADTYDEEKIFAALIPFNAVLEQAAAAMLSDLGNPEDASQFMAEWKPRTRLDTWFGPDPANFLRHVMSEGKIHRRGAMPDESALR
jgi:hypothetical protein